LKRAEKTTQMHRISR